MVIIQFARTLRFSRKLFQTKSVFPTWYAMAPIHGSGDGNKYGELIDEMVMQNHVVIFSKTFCPYCIKVKQLFTELGQPFKAVELDVGMDGDSNFGEAMQCELAKKTTMKTVPNVFVNKQHVGGCDATLKADKTGKLGLLLKGFDIEYDLVVVGGGSGGLAASKEAKRLGMHVAVLDYVSPTPIGTKWGLGGTCVNVGCIPKKLMHKAAIIGEDVLDAPTFGWSTSRDDHNWTTMVGSITNYIKSLNFKYRSSLIEKGISYINAQGQFEGPHKLKLTDQRGKESTITTNKIIIATGGRPVYPDIEGAKEYGITSDDIFFLKYNPGKTLLVGASYIALECAGFLNKLGISTTVMVRSILLRGFDQQVAEMIGKNMETHGVSFLRGFVPSKLELVSPQPKDDRGNPSGPGVIKVTFQGADSTSDQREEEYNTVIFAVGRQATTEKLELGSVDVQVNPTTHKIIVNELEQTSNPNIFAIGDVISGQLELTPVAIQAGKLLSRRLFGDSTAVMDYSLVPTTVFTPLEYGCIGLSEESAILQYGSDNIEVYHTHFQPLEFELTDRDRNSCYAKIICVKSENERVVGFHVLSPNAGEITQGFALGLKLGATKSDFSNLVGIHPTCAEWFTVLDISKSSGQSVTDASC